MATAIMRGNNGPAQRQLNGKAPAADAAVLPPLVEDETPADPESDDSPAATPQPRTRKSTAVKSPQIVEVDFIAAATPLKAFLAKVRATDAMTVTKRYLAIAFWFKHYGGTAEITMDHVHTAFRHYGLE